MPFFGLTIKVTKPHIFSFIRNHGALSAATETTRETTSDDVGHRVVLSTTAATRWLRTLAPAVLGDRDDGDFRLPGVFQLGPRWTDTDYDTAAEVVHEAFEHVMQGPANLLDVHLSRPETVGTIGGDTFTVSIHWDGRARAFHLCSPPVKLSDLDLSNTLRGPDAAIVLLHAVTTAVTTLIQDLDDEITANGLSIRRTRRRSARRIIGR
jgi:hypothetical protein